MSAREKLVEAVNRRMGSSGPCDPRRRTSWDDWPALDTAVDALIAEAIVTAREASREQIRDLEEALAEKRKSDPFFEQLEKLQGDVADIARQIHAAVIAEEREACAVIVEQSDLFWHEGDPRHRIATKIRARGSK